MNTEKSPSTTDHNCVCLKCKKTFEVPLPSTCPEGCDRELIELSALKDSDEGAPFLGYRIHDGKVILIGVLGQGGMGIVYLGLQSIVADKQRRVAVKFNLNADHNAKKRFMLEVDAMINIEHPSAIKLYDFGVFGAGINERQYMINEFIEGRTLSQFMKAERKAKRAITFARAARIIIPILNVLNEAHKKGIIHRDLKPANIMVKVFPGDDLQIKVMDFGISKFINNNDNLTNGMIIGTIRYMAPEQLIGEQSENSDIFSVGAILFELLTGHPLFQGKLDAITTLRVYNPEYNLTPPPRLDKNLFYVQSLLHKALAYDPNKRFKDAIEFLDAIRAILEIKTTNDETIAIKPEDIITTTMEIKHEVRPNQHEVRPNQHEVRPNQHEVRPNQ
ncbi:serine/threonine protein kinase, partial [Myxococcota bacterium]|nr:serine/threonine protein kinase [Myxococcota bacterium]